MKNIFLITLILSLCLSLQACREPRDADLPEGGEGRPFFHAETSIFHTLNVVWDETAITSDAEIWLSETDADFLFIDAAKDIKATMTYSYTKDEGSVTLSQILPDGSCGDAFTFESGDAASPLEETAEITLLAGTNHFRLSGNDTECSLKIEITGDELAGVTDVNAFPKDAN